MAEKIVKKDWVSNFTLIGKPKISEDYTFKIDEKSEKSAWVYNSLNLGIDCGEKYGVVYAEMMGGYSEAEARRMVKENDRFNIVRCLECSRRGDLNLAYNENGELEEI